MGNSSKSAIRQYISIVNNLHKAVGYTIALMLGVMSALIFWQVFARFVLGSGLSFSEEVTRFLQIWMTILGAAYALREGSLLAVDILLHFSKDRVRKVMKVCIILFSSFFYFILIRYGIEMAISVAGQTAPSTHISMALPMAALPVGGAIMFINSLALLFEEFVGGEA